MAESSALPASTGASFRLTPRGDARLARAAAAGDERAFALIFERYHQELYRFCRALLNDPHDAQDALQATMASALHGLPGEERTIELRPWLYRVARNEAITIVRRRQSVRAIDETQLPAEPSAGAAFESRERLRTLVGDLNALPERQRSALVMRELSGLSYDQVGAALDTSGAAARQVVYEARLALQDLEEGRAMSCGQVRRAISEGDGRVLRGRKLRAHLRGCHDCTGFRAAIATRRHDLEAIAPPLPALAASGVLASLVSSGAGGAGAGALGGLLGTGIGAKPLAIVVATAAVGIGAGTAADVDLPLFASGERPAVEAPATQASPEPERRRHESAAGGGAPQRASHARSGEGKRAEHARGHGKGGVNGAPQGVESSAAGGASAAAPAGAGQPQRPPGSGVATDRSDGRNISPTTGPPAEPELDLRGLTPGGSSTERGNLSSNP